MEQQWPSKNTLKTPRIEFVLDKDQSTNHHNVFNVFFSIDFLDCGYPMKFRDTFMNAQGEKTINFSDL